MSKKDKKNVGKWAALVVAGLLIVSAAAIVLTGNVPFYNITAKMKEPALFLEVEEQETMDTAVYGEVEKKLEKALKELPKDADITIIDEVYGDKKQAAINVSKGEAEFTKDKDFYELESTITAYKPGALMMRKEKYKQDYFFIVHSPTSLENKTLGETLELNPNVDVYSALFSTKTPISKEWDNFGYKGDENIVYLTFKDVDRTDEYQVDFNAVSKITFDGDKIVSIEQQSHTELQNFVTIDAKQEASRNYTKVEYKH